MHKFDRADAELALVGSRLDGVLEQGAGISRLPWPTSLGQSASHLGCAWIGLLGREEELLDLVPVLLRGGSG